MKRIDIKRFMFDQPAYSNQGLLIDRWLYGCVFFTVMYVLFALILLAIPGLSRGGFVSVFFGGAWLIYGVMFKNRIFPAILYLPLVFYVVIFSSGFMVDYYPVIAVGKLGTAWLGGVMVTTFVANGLSMRFVALCYVVIILANFLAYATGFDEKYLMVIAAGEHYHDYLVLKRAMGMAGQTNLLVAFVFTFPFLLFLFRKRLGGQVVVACTALCVAFMFITASRSTLPFTFLFFICGCTLLIRNFWVKYVIGSVGLIFLSLCAYVLITYPIVHIVSNSALADIAFIDRILEALYRESGSVDYRVGLVRQFVPHFLNQPLLGYGPNQFATVAGYGSYAHNNPAELLINYGIIGTALYYSMYIVVLTRFFALKSFSVYLVPPLLFLIACDFVFITHVERPLVLLLCLLLLTSCSTPKKYRQRRSHEH